MMCHRRPSRPLSCAKLSEKGDPSAGSHTLHQQPDYQQVQGVEDIEEVLPGFAPDEAPAAIVHAQRDEGKTGEKPRGEEAGTRHRLVQEPLPEEIQHHDERVAGDTVVRPEEKGDGQKSRQAQRLLERVPVPEMLRGQHAEESQQQGEDDILAREMPPGAAVHQVPGNFREDGERGQQDAVLLFGTGMPEALDQKEGEYGESQAPESAHEEIWCDGPVPQLQQAHLRPRAVLPEEVCQMVCEHAQHRQDFQGASAEAFPFYSHTAAKIRKICRKTKPDRPHSIDAAFSMTARLAPLSGWT